jgi:mitochondrial fission protein ELM1
MTDARPITGECWVLTDGKAGTENQCIGLAEAAGFEPVVKRIEGRPPWRWLPTTFWTLPLGQFPLSTYAATGDGPLRPPYPRLLIASGRASVAPAIAIRRLSPSTMLVQIQDPRVNPKHFDLVAAPRHDQLKARNVVETAGALHRITPEKLEAEAAKFADRFSDLPHPLVAVLLGGSSRHHQMTPAIATRLGNDLAALCWDQGAGLLITASRRTGAQNIKILRDALKSSPVFFWDGQGDNPYFAFLGSADYLIVTEDSVSMTSESASTGKPVYIAELKGGAAKFDAFHRALRDQGVTRLFQGQLDTWTYLPINDTADVADRIRVMLGLGDKS